MRRQPIPPLCGGAVQALPNIQTTPRDHPHPASRPMTFGHFTSWRADDRGYYTGAWVQDDATTRACAPHGIFFQGIVAPGRRANVIEGVREIRKAVGHIFGANFRHMHLLYMIHVVYETCDHADDRGYYSGPRGRRRRRDDARMWPAWYFLQGIVAPGRRAKAVERACESSSRELM